MICTLGPLTTELCGLQYQRIGFRGRSHVFRSTVAVFTHSATGESGGWEPDEDRSNAGRKCQEMFELTECATRKAHAGKAAQLATFLRDNGLGGRYARLPLSGLGEMNSCRKSPWGCPKRGSSNERRIGQVDHVRLGVALKVNSPDFSRLTSPIDILCHECFERWYGVLRVCRGGSSSCRGRWTPSAGTITRDGATHWQIARSAYVRRSRDYLAVPSGPAPTLCLRDHALHQPEIFAGRGLRLRASLRGPGQVLSGRPSLREYSTESTPLQQ